jgi:beta-galactosidase
MARLPTDVKRRSWQEKLLRPGQSLPIRKQLDEPHNGEEILAGAPPRLTIPLNQDWNFRRMESTAQPEVIPPEVTEGQGWEAANLPHSVRLEPANASAGRNFQGICWYSRSLELPVQWKEKIVYLHFEGAMQVAEVWLNKTKLASNHCGYLPFVVDLTRAANFGPGGNILSVRLDNRDNPQVPPGKPQKELDFTYFGGLYRNVRLEVMDRLHIIDPILEDKIAGGGVFVTFSDVTQESATVWIRTDVRNEHLEPRDCQVVHQLFDPDGLAVGKASAACKLAPGGEMVFHQVIDVANPRLWHPYHPHLYELRTTVMGNDQPADEQTSRIGIRHIGFDRDRGLTINGEKFFSMGVNRHQDHPYVGYALPDSAQHRDVKKLREAGFTSVRSHYPQSPAFMDACDELGMLAIVSNPGWQFVGGSVFQERAVKNARRMVRRDRNRPSVVIWEAALNESDNLPLLESLHRAVHEEFPGDQCFTAGDRESESAGWDVEYLHNDGSKPVWIREWGDQVDNWSDQQSRSRVPRGWGETPLLIQARSHASRMDEILAGRSNHANTSQVNRLCGACLWAGIDCQRGYHRQPFFGGVLDLFRLPKFNYYFFKSQSPPEIHVPGLDDGPMVFIANFATFLSPTSVTVFSNCDEVRLTLDGREIGRKKPDTSWSIAHPPLTFEVECFAHEQSTMYMTGVAKVEPPPVELIAEGIIDGKVVATHRVCPPGVARTLVLQADLCGRDLAADGSDWVRVHAKICDARGTVCPFADDIIEFSIEDDGEGEARIIGNEQIGANPVRAEAGIATVLVQAGRTAGKITVNATAFGLTPGRAVITSVTAR